MPFLLYMCVISALCVLHYADVLASQEQGQDATVTIDQRKFSLQVLNRFLALTLYSNFVFSCITLMLKLKSASSKLFCNI